MTRLLAFSGKGKKKLIFTQMFFFFLFSSEKTSVAILYEAPPLLEGCLWVVARVEGESHHQEHGGGCLRVWSQGEQQDGEGGCASLTFMTPMNDADGCRR